MGSNIDRYELRNLNWRGEDIAKRDTWKIPYSDANNQCRIEGLIKSIGFVVITDVPVVKTTTDEAVAIFQSEVLRFGCPVSQSAKLDFLGYVTDKGTDIANHKGRGYESAAELPFHSDRCDLLTLLCVRQAPRGGETRVVSAYAAYTELAQTQPELAKMLCQPFPIDLRDTTGSKPWAMMPIFSFENETFVARYVRRFIKASQRFDDAPRLTQQQIAALDALDAILNAPQMSIDLKLRPGDWLLIDNHRMLHARSEFQDSENPEQARLLLRSWLCWPGSPKLPQSFLPTYGRTDAGSYRGGVWPEAKPLTSMPADIKLARKELEEMLSWLRP